MLTISGDGSFTQAIVGESHYQRWLEEVTGGRTAESAECYAEAALVIEHTNPHDQFAVRADVLGGTVGYLSRDDARAYRRWLAHSHGRLADAICPAVIRGGWDRNEGRPGNYGVWLDLPPFLPPSVTRPGAAATLVHHQGAKIALANPRSVLVPLEDFGKRDGHYLVYDAVREFLSRRGWKVAGSGNLYLYVDPPAGVRKPFRLAAEIPEREQIERLAGELHATRRQWSGWVGEWWAIYLPPEPRGDWETPAHFQIGNKSLWTATMNFMPDGPTYQETASFPSS